MLDVSPTPPRRPDVAPHAFEPPGDGLPTCMHPACGRARSAPVHLVALTRSRVMLVVDHHQGFTAEQLELLIAQAFASVPGITLQQMQPLL